GTRSGGRLSRRGLGAHAPHGGDRLSSFGGVLPGRAGGRAVPRIRGTSAVFRLLGNWLLLVTGGGPTEDKPTVTFAQPADPDTVSTGMIFRVPDCRAAYEALRGRGADFLTPPVDRGGEIRAFFRDPDGYLFEI